jgi:hypothetical protein
MALTCKEAARISLAAVAGHAAEADRLELEGHLGGCAVCGEEHAATLALVRGLGAAPPEGLSAAARETVRQALAARAPRAGAPAARASGARRLGLWLALAGASSAAVAAVAVWVRTSPLAPELAAWSRGVVVERQGRTGDRERVSSDAGGELALERDVHVELGRATAFAWIRSMRRMELDRGSLTVDVEHRPGQYFEVETPRFTVVVVGTRFHVDLQGVHTERGIVKVVLPDGSVAARVEGGQAWSVDAPAAPPVAEVPSPPAPAERPAPAPRARAAVEPSAAERLGEARRSLARGDAPAARRIVAPLFHLGRDVGVEARILFAESFLVEGRYADAIDGYRVVVRDFPGTSQAESSQFALAQLASEHGRAEEARAALQAYLDRYPHGRFSREAALRLSKLSPRER